MRQIIFEGLRLKESRWVGEVLCDEIRVPVALSQEDSASPDATAILVMKLKAALDQIERANRI